jgi:hypothetical protein
MLDTPELTIPSCTVNPTKPTPWLGMIIVSSVELINVVGTVTPSTLIYVFSSKYDPETVTVSPPEA